MKPKWSQDKKILIRKLTFLQYQIEKVKRPTITLKECLEIVLKEMGLLK